MLPAAMSIASSLLPEFDEEMGNTRKVLERVPEGKWDFKPHPKSMSLAGLSGHLADVAEWGKVTMEVDELAMKDSEFKPYLPETTAGLVEHFEASRKQFRDVLESATDEAMNKNWVMTWNGHPVISMPRAAVIRSMVFNHMIHHRAQLGVYLRMLDVAVPGIYGPSADEMPPKS